jgi:hypothetical protein
MPSGPFPVSGGWVVPTIDESKVPNFQFLGTFTADPTTDIITTSINHNLIDLELVMVWSSGTLPAPLVGNNTIYRVPIGGVLSPTTFKLAENSGGFPLMI